MLDDKADALSETQSKSMRKRQRRTRIPEKPNKPANLWSIMKNCIGKDLSKIPMPVNFSEPLSFLQRVAEDFTYSYLLDQAASCTDSSEQLAIIAAFAISCYSTTAVRTAKPFNPLLGETFELDRSNDLGWKLITEQVSHHPPITAQYCESPHWTCWQEFAMTSKFRGKYLTIIPTGISRITFQSSSNNYSWTKVTTTINNIIIGKLWVDNAGDMVIINHKDSSKCQVSFAPYSMFRADEIRKVSGKVIDKKGNVKWLIDGKWDNEVAISPVVKSSDKPPHLEEIGVSKLIWKVDNLPEDSQKYYNFSAFTCQLNEEEDGVAPTDSRLRPDQRLMEDGNWDEANALKERLEEKQRDKKRLKAVEGQSVPKRLDEASKVNRVQSRESEELLAQSDPTWFKLETDPITGRPMYVYKGGYWEAKKKQDWSKCPDIYL